jgi:hypothetical protein
VADLLLLGPIAGFVRGGWSSGSLRRLAGLVFLAVSFVAGAYLRQPVGAILQQFFPSTIGQVLIHTTVPFVLGILGPPLPTDVDSLIPTDLPGQGLPGLGNPGFPFPVN